MDAGSIFLSVPPIRFSDSDKAFFSFSCAIFPLF